MSQVVSDSGNIDKHAGVHVDPSRINLVERIGLLAIYIVGVDLQQVVSSSLVSGKSVVERRHVVVGGKIIHAGFRYLAVSANTVSLASFLHKTSLCAEERGPSSGGFRRCNRDPETYTSRSLSHGNICQLSARWSGIKLAAGN